jgi:hypothetical protein
MARQNPKQLVFYQMKNESALRILRSLLTIYHVAIATIGVYQNVSMDVDLGITNSQIQFHLHAGLAKKLD